METTGNRRRFLATAGAAGAIGLLGRLASVRAEAGAEPSPEVTTVRLPKGFRATCEAPKNVAEEFLHAEGFAEVRYLDFPVDVDAYDLLANGEIDFSTDFAPPHILAIDAGRPVKVLAGLHSGCLELIAREGIDSVADLKGRKVGVFTLTSAPHLLVSIMAAYIGLDPSIDIEWVESPDKSAMELFNEGKVDAFMGAPPEPQEQRARNYGHPILRTTFDEPWSQHFCCMLSSSTDFVENHPVATKRVVRAILKTADLCASDPELVARLSVDRNFTDDYDHALQGLRETRYDRWREFDPEDTLRFYALRMKELGFIEASPNRIIADGTEWRFLDEIKRELKT